MAEESRSYFQYIPLLDEIVLLRPHIQADLKAFLNGKNYDQLFNGLWQVYNKTLEGFDLEKHCEHLIPVETNRGKRIRQLKQWIIELFEKEQTE